MPCSTKLVIVLVNLMSWISRLAEMQDRLYSRRGHCCYSFSNRSMHNNAFFPDNVFPSVSLRGRAASSSQVTIEKDFVCPRARRALIHLYKNWRHLYPTTIYWWTPTQWTASFHTVSSKWCIDTSMYILCSRPAITISLKQDCLKFFKFARAAARPLIFNSKTIRQVHTVERYNIRSLPGRLINFFRCCASVVDACITLADAF